jgi:hypothetical protein
VEGGVAHSVYGCVSWIIQFGLLPMWHGPHICTGAYTAQAIRIA